jgi:hypothetical protein
VRSVVMVFRCFLSMSWYFEACPALMSNR